MDRNDPFAERVLAELDADPAAAERVLAELDADPAAAALRRRAAEAATECELRGMRGAWAAAVWRALWRAAAAGRAAAAAARLAAGRRR